MSESRGPVRKGEAVASRHKQGKLIIKDFVLMLYIKEIAIDYLVLCSFQAPLRSFPPFQMPSNKVGRKTLGAPVLKW